MTKPDIDNDFLDQLTFEPLNKSNWAKFVQLFGAKGACGNCWCMYYRLGKADFVEGKADDGNKNAMHNLDMDHKPAGILGFYDGQPIAWCAFAPREDFIKLEKSNIEKQANGSLLYRQRLNRGVETYAIF